MTRKTMHGQHTRRHARRRRPHPFAMGIMTAVAAMCLTTAAPVWAATTLRCGHKLVKVGAPKYIVEAYCGSPVSKDFVGQTTYHDGYKKQKVLIEEWIYDMRSGFFDILTFRGGRLIKMEWKQK